MSSTYAFVTLVSSDSYLPGALALAAALNDVHPSPPVDPEVPFQTVCLVTPESVDVSTIKLLRRAFNVVIGVEILEHENERGLRLLGRPDLTTVLTKLHIFRLTQYSKVIFLDADVLPIRPLSHLFKLPYEFSAVPDVGWPDIFNSGVLVLTPGEDKFTQINDLLKTKGTWDGGDQGILNEWCGGDWNRLSFTYNTTPTAAYTYAPAYERYGSQISAIHFIGSNKPWKSISYRAPFTSRDPAKSDSVQQAYDYESLVDRWYSVYDKHYRSTTILPQSSFEVKRYSSAWNEAPSIQQQKDSSANNVLSLEDLRKLAIEGLNTSGKSSDDHPSEGEYRSLPLEGRVDLMRPQKEPPKNAEFEEEEAPQEVERRKGWGYDHEQEYSPSTPVPGDIMVPDPSLRWRTLPTPAPDDFPPSPRPGFISLPPTPTPNHDFYQESCGSESSDRDVGILDFAPAFSSRGHSHHDHHHSRRGSPQSHRGSPQNHRGSPQHNHGSQSGHGEHRHHRRSPTHEQGNDHDRHNHHHVHPRQERHHSHEYHEHAPQQAQDGHEHHYHQPQPQYQHDHHHHQQQQQHHEEPQRPSSPPMLVWNPAVEPPPTTTPAASAFPTDTYFPNIWDKAPSREHDQPHHRGPAHTESGGFFQPPPPSQIPAPLREQGHYRSVTGDNHESPPVPDPSKVKSVFPWEEKPRHLPGRVFPEADAPKPSLFLSPPNKDPPTPLDLPETPRPKSAPPARVLSPLHGLPGSLTYMNAWDTVPSIQKYASKLVRPTPPPPLLTPSFDSDGWRDARRKSWDERTEASSRDGDDEDNADDEDDDDFRPRSGNWDDDSDDEAAKKRSRRGSTASASYTTKAKKKEYRSRGVQTVRREKRHQGIQAAAEVPAPPRPEQKRKLSYSASKRHWPPLNHTLSPSSTATQEVSTGHDLPMSTAVPSPVSEVPGGHTSRTRNRLPPPSRPSVNHSPLRSPREFVVSPLNAPARPLPRTAAIPPKTAPPPRVSVPVAKPPTPTLKSSTPPPKSATPSPVTSQPPQKPSPTRASRPPSVITRQISNGSSLPSPVSSAGPLSPPDGQPISGQVKRGGRVWDPARGVDLFKRSSEEVLARFLKMGSWEDENGR
ncbi:hypothetical protein BDQ12DRAFT_686149 [Crucibulum laeve]|uniref:glycogenin glucosyltransferase n=1 Tax=Crucibulum laeve TaxID=68775 RepID=A0A5C3LX34_9AGAR|nr:hypothetical protein BDQ12DRAFT_686149 [Crucibulum laeve]